MNSSIDSEFSKDLLGSILLRATSSLIIFCTTKGLDIKIGKELIIFVIKGFIKENLYIIYDENFY